MNSIKPLIIALSDITIVTETRSYEWYKTLSYNRDCILVKDIAVMYNMNKYTRTKLSCATNIPSAST